MKTKILQRFSEYRFFTHRYTLQLFRNTFLLLFISLFFSLNQTINAQQRIGRETKLLPDSLENFNNIGRKIASSGNIAIVSGTDVETGNATAFIFEFDGKVWIQIDRLKIVEQIPEFSSVGCFDVAIEGDVAVVGVNITDMFSKVYIYVFNYNGVKWNAVQQIYAGTNYGSGGHSLSLSSKSLILGMPGFEGGFGDGTVMYEFDGLVWIKKQILQASDTEDLNNYGCSVDVYNDKAVVGSLSGRAYVFYLDGNVWKEKQILRPSNSTYFADFGSSVAIRKNSILVGNRSDDLNGTRSGSAYIFNYNGNEWHETQKIIPDDGTAWDVFGTNVTISDDILAVGAPGNRDNRGAAYIYEFTGAGWEQKYKLVKGDDETNDPELEEEERFGSDVFINQNLVIVGCQGSYVQGKRLGACYLYEYIAQPGNVISADGESYNQVRISWNNRSNNADGFRIYRDGIEIGSTVLAATVFNDMDAIPGKLYNYEVTAYNNFWEESLPSFNNIGWRKADGNIKGSVQTKQGAGIKGVDISAALLDSTLGLSLYYDGVDDHVVLPVIPSNNSMTISAWIKTSSINNQEILGWGNTENGHFIEFKTQNGHLIYNESDTQSGVRVVSSKKVNTGKWEYVALVVSPSATRLYINGLADRNVNEAHSNPDVNTLTIGALQVGPDFTLPFSGWIDDIQLWNRTLTGEEIKENMFYGLDGDEDGLFAYWSFDDSTRSTELIAGDYAYSGNNHGKIKGAEWSDQGAPVGHNDITDDNGDFNIWELFYDDSREFRVTPTKEKHLFDPEYKDVVLEHSVTTTKFTDTTVLTLSGHILFAGTDCPSVGVELLIDGDTTGAITDTDGTFDLIIEEPGKTYTITPRFEDSISAHSFSPAEIKLLVEDDRDGLNFIDNQKHLLYGKVRGGCIAGLGTAKLRVSSFENEDCLDNIITTDVQGNYRAHFPAQKYIVDLINIDNSDSINILNYFPPDTIDLTWENKRNNLIYHPKPLIQIEIDPLELTCDDVPIMKQNYTYSIIIEVKEAYDTTTCHVSEGYVTIYDDIGGNPAEPTIIELENGMAAYNLIAGEPNILGNFQKLMQIEANVDDQITIKDVWVLVTGNRPRTKTFFSTTTPELPLMILRDPPGDNSYSFLSKGSTYTTKFLHEFDRYIQGGVYADINIGAIVSTGWRLGTGLTWDFGAYGFVRTEIIGGAGKGADYGNLMSLTMLEEFRTSDNEGGSFKQGDVYIGGADVFIGLSLYQTFYISDGIKYDLMNCQIVRDTTLFIEYDSLNSSYIYTEDHIRNTLIPQLEGLKNLDSDSLHYYNTAISVWNQVLFKNDSLKNEAQAASKNKNIPDPEYLLEKNISFSGGTSTTQYTTVQTDTFNTVSYSVILDAEVLAGIGIVAFGSVYELGTKWKFHAFFNDTYDTTLTEINTVGYTLADDDQGDFFSVDILHDPYYGTPIFNLVAGTSSCPWEDGTQPRDGAQLGINSFKLEDVRPDKPAVFTLTLGNLSESGEARPYDLRLVQLSNPDGAIIKVGGVPMDDALSYYIPAGDSAYRATLTVERGPLAYDYENLQLIMVPPCEYDAYNDNTKLADTITFSVHFASSLSNATIAYPSNDWKIEQDDPDSMQVVINEYNAQNEYLDAIKFQYRKPNGSWNDIFEVKKDELTSQNIRRYWNYSQLEDGEYELRAVSDGGINGVRYSSVAKGLIERKSLIINGKPEPSDAVLNIEDQISIKFGSGINVEKLDFEKDISLFNAADTSAIKFSVIVEGNKLQIKPDTSFTDLGTCNLIASVRNIEDMNGNRLRNPVEWSFEVSQSTAYWKSISSEFRAYEGHESVSNGIIYNAGSESVDYQIKYLPSWLLINSDEMNGTIDKGTERYLTFNVSEQIPTGKLNDSIVVALPEGEMIKPVSVNVLPAPPPWNEDNLTGGGFVEQIYAQLLLSDKISTDEFDILGVFIDNELLGKGNVRLDEGTGKYLAAFPVYYNSSSGGSFEFRLWDADEGKEHRYYSDEYSFQAESAIGSRSAPILIEPNESYQTIPIKNGWNWVSFNVATPDLFINRVLEDYHAKQGDLIKNQYTFSEYTTEQGWIGNLEFLSLGTGFRIKSNDAGEMLASGLRASNWATPALLTKGWNWIGYLPEEKLSVKDALYFMEAIPGDIIKSQDKSALFNNNGEWLGTLNELEPGKGYLLYTESPKLMVYPDLKKQNNNEISFSEKEDWTVNVKDYQTSMTLISEYELLDEAYGDSSTIAAAFINGECRGLVKPKYLPHLNKYISFMMIYGSPEEVDEAVSFKLYDSANELVRDVENVLVFGQDAHYGSLTEPQVLEALQTDSERIPTNYYLHQNYPNPFNPTTTINYGLPFDGDVKISLFNILGERVRVLVNEIKKAGRYSLLFEADKIGLASGIYFYQIKSNKFIMSKKMLLLK